MDVKDIPEGARVRIEFEAVVHTHNEYGWTSVYPTDTADDPERIWAPISVRTRMIREVLADPLTEHVGAVIDLERADEPTWRFMLTTSGWIDSSTSLDQTYNREEMIELIKSSGRKPNLIIDGGGDLG